jgi:hypothetical protein
MHGSTQSFSLPDHCTVQNSTRMFKDVKRLFILASLGFKIGLLRFISFFRFQNLKLEVEATRGGRRPNQ